MTGIPSYPPKNPGKRPSADGASVIRGRKQRMSKPSPAEQDGAQQALPDSPRRDNMAGGRTSPPQRGAGSPDTPPPVYAPRAQQAGRPRPSQPLGLPIDDSTPPQRSAQDQGSQRPAQAVPRPPQAPPKPRKRFRKRRVILPIILLLVVALIAWPFYLYTYGNSKLEQVEALSGSPDTPGKTVLFAGLDRDTGDGGMQRSDSIMLVHIPESGNPSLISLPRDTYVEIPGYGYAKLNSSYSRGGPELLVQTVEHLSGLTIDHFVQVEMHGVSDLVDAVGGVELCLDYDVNDSRSDLVWEAGCHEVDGERALQFSRMRYSDPLGDIGRTARQRQVIAKVMDKALSPATIINPMRQRDLVGSTASVLTTDTETDLFDLAMIAWPMRTIMGPSGVIGTPPILSLNYQPGGVGSTVLLDPERTDEFFRKVADGSITREDVAASLP